MPIRAGRRCAQCQQRQSHEPDRHRVDMAVAGDLPHGYRIPGIDQHAFPGQPGPRQQVEKDGNGQAFEGGHRNFHAGEAGTRQVHHEEDSFGYRRVDGGRGGGTIDMRIDILVAQGGEFRRGGHVTVRVDPGSLDTSIPDVAVDIGRQGRWRGEEDATHQHGASENDP